MLCTQWHVFKKFFKHALQRDAWVWAVHLLAVSVERQGHASSAFSLKQLLHVWQDIPLDGLTKVTMPLQGC
jgi:hypothetical protein